MHLSLRSTPTLQDFRASVHRIAIPAIANGINVLRRGLPVSPLSTPLHAALERACLPARRSAKGSEPKEKLLLDPAGKQERAKSGMTLAEVLVATIVVGTVCFAALSGMLFSLRTADSNLLALSAASSVRSIAEQLQAVDYLTLFNSELPVDVPSNAGGTLTAAEWNTRTEDLHRTPDNPGDDLQLRIRPTVTRVSETGGVDYAQVVISYEWRDSSFFVARTRTNTFTMIVASVSSF